MRRIFFVHPYNTLCPPKNPYFDKITDQFFFIIYDYILTRCRRYLMFQTMISMKHEEVKV